MNPEDFDAKYQSVLQSRDMWKQQAEKSEAEVARLRKVNETVVVNLDEMKAERNRLREDLSRRCCCVTDGQDEIVEWCAVHAAIRDERALAHARASLYMRCLDDILPECPEDQDCDCPRCRLLVEIKALSCVS